MNRGMLHIWSDPVIFEHCLLLYCGAHWRIVNNAYPLAVDSVEVELVRAGKVETCLIGREPVTDRPFPTDNALLCISTEDEKF